MNGSLELGANVPIDRSEFARGAAHRIRSSILNERVHSTMQSERIHFVRDEESLGDAVRAENFARRNSQRMELSTNTFHEFISFRHLPVFPARQLRLVSSLSALYPRIEPRSASVIRVCDSNDREMKMIRDAVLSGRDSPGSLEFKLKNSLRLMVALQAAHRRPGDRLALVVVVVVLLMVVVVVVVVVRVAPSGVDGLPDEQVLRELLALDAAAVARDHPEAGVQQPGDRLHRVQLAVAVEREPYDVAGVLLVPGDPGARVDHRLRRLRKHLVQQSAAARQHHPLAQVRAHVQRHALVAAVAVVAAHLLRVAVTGRGGAGGGAAADVLPGRRWARRRRRHRRGRAVLDALLLHLLQLPAHRWKKEEKNKGG